jgi:dienelactone hydrolase
MITPLRLYFINIESAKTLDLTGPPATGRNSRTLLSCSYMSWTREDPMRRLIFALSVSVMTSAAFAALANDMAARTELHAIDTLTLSDAQFLSGDANARKTVTTGALRIPGREGRLPVVVLQHGSGGMAANVEMWSRELNALGVSTLALDGFTGRGLTSVNTNQALLGRLNFVLDVYRALDVVAKHPRVDPQRIALMGFSRGGQAALYASLKRFHKMWNRSGIEFAAYIPFYPDCATTFVTDTEVADRPIRIFGGMQDDYNPVALCKAYVARLKATGHDAQVTEYPTASHAFDNPLGPIPPAVVAGGQTVRHCTIREEPTGVLINASTHQPFTYKDPCVEIGPHVGYDAAATEAAKAAVKEILSTVFALQLVGR